MSFMYNPFPYDDPQAVNRPKLSEEVINSVVSGTANVADHLAAEINERIGQKQGALVVALEGYISAEFAQLVNLIAQRMQLRGIPMTAIPFAACYKSTEELDALAHELLEYDTVKDPVKLFGKVFQGGYEGLVDPAKVDAMEERISKAATQSAAEVIIVYGNGCALRQLRAHYDLIGYLDVTPKESILRARRGHFANIGDKTPKPVKELIRRCYYIDFESAVRLRGDLIKSGAIDYYLMTDHAENYQLMPGKAFRELAETLVRYPFRCKPVYIEGVWGGTYVKKLRHLPDTMRNCAWVFDLIPMEVSLVVETGKTQVEFPYFTFIQHVDELLMGAECVRKFKGYFPIRFNYDDSFHSNGNMSIQVHSGHDYNVENYNEFGRQDESYYVVVTGHEAKTYLGFNEGINPQEFIDLAKKSEKDFSPIDYQKYINHVVSRPGIQMMIPAGTIHSSGRNQVVLEIGSLTIGSYTYKMYDYLRADLDGVPRPIHTYHGERVLKQNRTTSWVNQNIVQQPRKVRGGEGWAEYVLGEHDLLYFSLRRLEFEKEIEDDTAGVFHVLVLVDGERVMIQSVEHPERYFIQNYMDMVVVPANMGKYVIKNLGHQPVYMHKTRLKDGFVNDDPHQLPND